MAKFDAYRRVNGPVEVITTLDLAKGYWQIPMDEELKDKTAFTTPFGLHESEVMPFSTPATFQSVSLAGIKYGA